MAEQGYPREFDEMGYSGEMLHRKRNRGGRCQWGSRGLGVGLRSLRSGIA